MKSSTRSRRARACIPIGGFPAADVKNHLELNFVAVPTAGTQYGEKGWLFAIVAKLLEDRDMVEFNKEGRRSFYRSK